MVTLKASYMVKPSGATPTGPMYLSEVDKMFPLTHTHTIYFYPPITDNFLSNPIEILKNSLSKTLTIFYPIAGRLQWTDRGRLELNCNSMGALFLETESEATINDFGDFTPTLKTRALTPFVDYEKPLEEIPLLLVQVTKFSCGGICLGFATSHALCDGRGAAHFFSEWSRIARGEEPENLPVLDRTILKLEVEEDVTPQRDDHSVFSPPSILIGQSNNLEEGEKKTIATMMLKLSKEQIQKLKNEANEYKHIDNSKPFTRYEVVAAHMWRCASKARQHEREQLTSIYIPVDFRSRIVPWLPKWYFGNAVSPVRATTTSKDLLSNPLACISAKIREATEKVTDEYVRSFLAHLKRVEDLSKLRYSSVGRSTQEPFYSNPNMLSIGWIGLSLGGVDFGWGEEIYMGPETVSFDGKSFIIPSRGEIDSFVILFWLQVAHMDAFKKLFYENI